MTLIIWLGGGAAEPLLKITREPPLTLKGNEMADWQRTLNLLPEWKQAQNNEISPQQMASVISNRLLGLRPFGDPAGIDWEREDIAGRFEDLSTDVDADTEDFDDLMNDLYNWADSPLNGSGGKVFGAQKTCWVRTF